MTFAFRYICLTVERRVANSVKTFGSRLVCILYWNTCERTVIAATLSDWHCPCAVLTVQCHYCLKSLRALCECVAIQSTAIHATSERYNWACDCYHLLASVPACIDSGMELTTELKFPWFRSSALHLVLIQNTIHPSDNVSLCLNTF